MGGRDRIERQGRIIRGGGEEEKKPPTHTHTHVRPADEPRTITTRTRGTRRGVPFSDCVFTHNEYTAASRPVFGTNADGRVAAGVFNSIKYGPGETAKGTARRITATNRA